MWRMASQAFIVEIWREYILRKQVYACALLAGTFRIFHSTKGLERNSPRTLLAGESLLERRNQSGREVLRWCGKELSETFFSAKNTETRFPASSITANV